MFTGGTIWILTHDHFLDRGFPFNFHLLKRICDIFFWFERESISLLDRCVFPQGQKRRWTFASSKRVRASGIAADLRFVGSVCLQIPGGLYFTKGANNYRLERPREIPIGGLFELV